MIGCRMTHLLELAQLHAARARPLGDDRGASLVEYALLLALIALVCIGAVTYFGSSTSDAYSSSTSSMFLGN